MTRLAICGLGNIGAVHLDNLRSLRGCRVVGAYDVRIESAQQKGFRHQIKIYSDLQELLADPGVDAVVVATPTDSHRSITLAALAAGKHVFVEKPLAGTLEDARAIANAARATNRCVQVGFCERFNVHYLEAKRAVRAGLLGTIRSLQSSRYAPYDLGNPAWELGVLDTAVHNIDLILWLVGRRPVAVSAWGIQVYPESTIPHAITILIRFDDGTLAFDHIAWVKDKPHPLSHCARSRMVLQGDAGLFTIDLTDRPSALLTPEAYRMCDTVILGGAEYASCLKLQFESFLRSIEEALPVQAPVEDALLTESVVLAARAALQTGREIPLGAQA